MATSPPIRVTPMEPLPLGSMRRIAPSRPVGGLNAYEQFARAYPDFIVAMRNTSLRWKGQLASLSHATVKEQHGLTRKLLRSREYQVLFAFKALRRASRLSTHSPRSIQVFAERFNAFGPVADEGVVTRQVTKGSGTRWVQDFGPHRRMQQAMVADLLRYLHPPPRQQTLFNGGIPAARKAVAAAYFEHGQTHGAEVDFVDFYGSIAMDELAGLLRPLPTSVVEHVVWDVAMRSRPFVGPLSSLCSQPTPGCLAGLSLGAATSPIVGEKIVAHLLEAAQLSDAITYADNVFVTGRSQQEMQARIHRLSASIASANVGHLGLRADPPRDARLTLPFEFVKHEGRVVDDHIVWGPGIRKILQYRVGAAEVASPRQIELAERSLANWRRYYPQWREGDVHEAFYRAELAARRFYIESSPVNRMTAVHAIVLAHFASGNHLTVFDLVPTEGDPNGARRNELIAEVVRWVDEANSRASSHD